MKVIILDDSRTDSYLASQVAQVYFDEVRVYGAPLELHTALATQRLPELILMDVHLGDLHNGIGELDSIRRKANEASIIPIIIVTASTDQALHSFALSCGASAVIVKPISREKLMPWLTRLLPQIDIEGK
ncbi:response regulator [Pseudomonas sp. MWU12-2323]|uniref:response regulator n=1 Tax=Pseudomonas sp. MWU12-2323 TaxID=2651296 RepID=UPI0015B6F33C|nr:response regulator [Pseudomonas sp. MWU12-2323]